MATLLFLFLALQSQSDATVRGQVINWETSAALPDATVTLMQGVHTFIRHADSEGRFAFENVPAGHYVLRVTAAGYVLREGASSLTGTSYKDVDVAINRTVDLRVEVVPAGTLKGTVFDSNDKALAGKKVVALQRQLDPVFKSVLGVQATTTTDTGGHYELKGLPLGEFFLKVEDRTPIYYPGANDVRDAAPVSVGTESTSAGGLDIHARAYTPVRLRGRIVKADAPDADEPLALLFLTPAGADGDHLYMESASASRTSHFELKDVAPGSYELFAVLTSNGRRYVARTHVEVHEESIDNIEATAYPEVDLSGRVFFNGSVAPPDFSKLRIILAPQLGMPILPSAISLGDGKVAPRPFVGGTVDPSGNIAIPAVLPFESRLVVSGLPPSYYVESAKLDNLEVWGQLFTVVPSSSSVDLIIGAPAGSIQGRVLDEKGTPSNESLITVLIPADNTANNDVLQTFKFGLSSRGGGFTFGGLGPGRYKLMAFRNVNVGLPFFNDEFIRKYEPQGTVVDVGPGSTVRTDVVAITVKP